MAANRERKRNGRENSSNEKMSKHIRAIEREREGTKWNQKRPWVSWFSVCVTLRVRLCLDTEVHVQMFNLIYISPLLFSFFFFILFLLYKPSRPCATVTFSSGNTKSGSSAEAAALLFPVRVDEVARDETENHSKNYSNWINVIYRLSLSRLKYRFGFNYAAKSSGDLNIPPAGVTFTP